MPISYGIGIARLAREKACILNKAPAYRAGLISFSNGCLGECFSAHPKDFQSHTLAHSVQRHCVPFKNTPTARPVVPKMAFGRVRVGDFLLDHVGQHTYTKRQEKPAKMRVSSQTRTHARHISEKPSSKNRRTTKSQKRPLMA